MTSLHVVLGVLLVTSSAAAGLFGAWRWYRVEPSQAFWTLLRISQAVVVLTAAQGGVLVLLGRDADGLHLLYGALPLAISFLAEQLRLAAAQTVLDARGLEGAAAMRDLEEGEQRSIVLQIVRREIGVMAASALVVALLGLRAAGWL